MSVLETLFCLECPMEKSMMCGNTAQAGIGPVRSDFRRIFSNDGKPYKKVSSREPDVDFENH